MKKILLIEDNTEMRENTAEILELAGYKVITAKDGKEGVSAANETLPDLIVCDIMMPVLDGYGVLALLSNNVKTASIPFIFLTAKAERSDLRKGMEMGADDYLTKPFDDKELLNAVEARLKKSKILMTEYAPNLTGLEEFFDDAKALQDLKNLSADYKTTHYRKKDIVYSEGKYPAGLFLVHKGKVKTFKTNEEGKELITGIFNEGDYFGYTTLFEDSVYADSATVMEDSDICTIPKSDFNELVNRNRDVAHKFIKILSKNIADKETQLLNLAYNSVRKRVADVLIALHEKYNKDDKSVMDIPISREDLSNLAGTSTESAIRTLSEFKDEKMIAVKGGNIMILDLQRLSRLKN